MSYITPVTISLGATESDGSGTFYSEHVTGFIEALKFTLGTLTSGADLTITDESSGLPIVTWTNPANGAVVYPRAALHDTAGAAALHAAGGTALLGKIPVSGRIKVVVADGGNAKTGSLKVVIS